MSVENLTGFLQAGGRHEWRLLVAGGKRVQRIPPRTNRANGQTYHGEPTAQPGDLGVESSTMKRRGRLLAFGPPRFGQSATRDHVAHAFDQGRHQPGLQWRKRHPVGPISQDPAIFETGGADRLPSIRSADKPLSSEPQRFETRLQVFLAGGNPDPILKRVHDRGWRPGGDKQQDRPTGCQEGGAPVFISRKSNQGHVHVKPYTMGCFAHVSAL